MDKHSAKIGKNVIESLTFGMYDDSRFVYREYIQNSADAIDKAVETKILGSRSDGNIHIDIDINNKIVTIEDNATGIKSSEIVRILKDIADSDKDRTKDKGFRGIGRLGGLAYCDKLIFESSVKGEKVKNIMIWDASHLRSIINNRHEKEDAGFVVDSITTFSQEKEDEREHYFKVILENVNNEELLDVNDIREYLSMVAPVPYPRRFIFSKKIYDETKKLKYEIDEYTIYINNEQLFKAYKTVLYEGDNDSLKKIDEVMDVETFSFYIGNELLVWGWYSISTFQKQLPERANLARGIRLRKGNIQIGSEYCLVKLHKEQRGNFYFLGEIHGVHKSLIPNARRDYFLENEVMKLFEKNIKKYFHDELYKLYHFGSKVRSDKKKIESFHVLKEELKEKNKIGFTDKTEKKKLEEKFEKVKEIAENAEKNINKYKEELAKEKSPKKKILEKVTKDIDTNVSKIEIPNNNGNKKIKFIVDNLRRLRKDQRKIVQRIFNVIDNVLTKELAENLKSKITEELK
jgi:molecular chaperone HtpG